MTMGKAPKILVVEDDPSIRRFLTTSLPLHGLEVVEAADLRAALAAVSTHPPDLVLLDLGLPDGDGVDFVHTVRGWSNLPILVVSARDAERTKVAALDAGADDYLTKPFGLDELRARIRVALRRAATAADPRTVPFEFEAEGRRLSVDPIANRVRVAESGGAWRDVATTPTEFRLLTALARHAGKVVTHSMLLREVWGAAHEADVAYLRVFVGQLRQKLEGDPQRPQWIVTELGVGYRMRERAE